MIKFWGFLVGIVLVGYIAFAIPSVQFSPEAQSGSTITPATVDMAMESMAASFPAAYTTTCLEDATDGQDDTPSTIAWVADDGGTTNTGSFDDPYDYNEELLGGDTGDNANWVDLWGAGVRTVCWKKVASNYTLIDNSNSATVWNQGPLLSGAPTQGMVNFAYPAAPVNNGSDAAFETATLISGNDGMLPSFGTFDPTNAKARGGGEWYGFRFGELGTTEGGGWNSWVNTDVDFYDATIKIEWNYFATTAEAGIAAATVGSGNDSSLQINNADGATVKHNYFADVDFANTRQTEGAAVVRTFQGINMEVSNNTFAICPENDENGWDSVYPKKDNDDWVFKNNEIYSLAGAGCASMSISLFQGSGAGKDADVGLWERNVYWNQTGNETGGGFTSQFGADDQTYRYNLAYGGLGFMTNGDPTDTSCDGNDTDHWQNVNAKADSNILIDIGDRIFIWFSDINNQFLTLNNNAIWFVDDTLNDYVDESSRGGGTYTDCGGATDVRVDANTPVSSAGIDNLNGLSYASGNTDSDPRMVCQYTGDNKCNGGTPAAPDDIRFCTGVNLPVSGCPGASPHVNGSGIAQIGPYQGEDMNADPSTYTAQIGAAWLPPASHR